MKKTKFKQTLVQTKKGSRHCEEHSDVAIQGGFKMTEVGLIPSDWSVEPLANIANTASGGTPSRSNEAFYKGSINWFTTTELKDCNLYDSVEHISKQAVECSSAKIFPKNTLLMAMYGATIGKLGLLKCDAATNQACCAIFPKKTDVLYLYYFLLHNRENIIAMGCGAGQPNVSQEIVKKINIPIPPTIEEQQRIANALSDVDALISTTEKLLQKKKNIKQGTMQQLLTGRKRLPGFGLDERTGSRPTDEKRKEKKGNRHCSSNHDCCDLPMREQVPVQSNLARHCERSEAIQSSYKMTELGLIPTDWENVNISKTCTIKARIGWQGLKSTEYLNSGDYILVTGTDFKNGFIDWSTCSYVSEWRFKQDKNIQIKKGDVLVTKDGTIGKVAFLNEIPMEGTLNSGVFVVRSKDLKKIDSVYLSLVFKSSWFDNFLDEITSGSTIVHLYQKDFVKFNFPIPSSIEEQTAIANVLSDMDTEISALETKLAKYRTLKTGMMQQLLTGKIRLV